MIFTTLQSDAADVDDVDDVRQRETIRLDLFHHQTQNEKVFFFFFKNGTRISNGNEHALIAAYAITQFCLH